MSRPVLRRLKQFGQNAKAIILVSGPHRFIEDNYFNKIEINTVVKISVLAFSVLTFGCHSDSQPIENKAGQHQVPSTLPEGVSDDLEVLRKMITIPGEPVRVIWGPLNIKSVWRDVYRLPPLGPIDVPRYDGALIEYNNSDVTAQWRAGKRWSGSIRVSNWYPKELRRRKESLDVSVYNNVKAFGGVQISIVDSHPRYIVISYECSQLDSLDCQGYVVPHEPVNE